MYMCICEIFSRRIVKIRIIVYCITITQFLRSNDRENPNSIVISLVKKKKNHFSSYQHVYIQHTDLQ